MPAALALAAYTFISNVALAIVPHEPAVIWYGARLGVWTTTLVATAATVLAAVADVRLFGPWILRLRARRQPSGVRLGLIPRLFQRAPFAILALSGLTPLPFFPFKALALASGYPLRSYLAAVTLRSLPRYALLAWLGVVIQLPAWALALAFIVLTLPALRLLWPPHPRRAS